MFSRRSIPNDLADVDVECLLVSFFEQERWSIYRSRHVPPDHCLEILFGRPDTGHHGRLMVTLFPKLNSAYLTLQYDNGVGVLVSLKQLTDYRLPHIASEEIPSVAT
jgi:hypothetical protein